MEKANLQSAVAFVEGGIQDSCDDACSICLDLFCQNDPSTAIAAQKEDVCQACGESGSLIGCGTCTYAFHLKCLLPPRKAALDDSWSCPECVSPLNEIEKILDSVMHPTTAEFDASKSVPKQKNIRQYLVKWKGLSYFHCTWIPDDEFKKASKINPRLTTRLNKFKE